MFRAAVLDDFSEHISWLVPSLARISPFSPFTLQMRLSSRCLVFTTAFHHTTPKLRFRRDSRYGLGNNMSFKPRKVRVRKSTICQNGSWSNPHQPGDVLANAEAGTNPGRSGYKPIALPTELILLLTRTWEVIFISVYILTHMKMGVLYHY